MHSCSEDNRNTSQPHAVLNSVLSILIFKAFVSHLHLELFLCLISPPLLTVFMISDDKHNVLLGWIGHSGSF